MEAGAQRTGVGSRRLGCTVRAGEAHRKFSTLSVLSLQSRGGGGSGVGLISPPPVTVDIVKFPGNRVLAKVCVPPESTSVDIFEASRATGSVCHPSPSTAVDYHVFRGEVCA